MSGPAFDPQDLGLNPRPGSYEAQLSDWANAKIAQGVDADVVRARVGDLVHTYRRSLADKPLTQAPETTGDKVAGGISSAYQGLTLGAGNKITAGVRTVLPQALGGVKGFDFPEALKEQTQVQRDFEQRHPYTAGALELAGSIPTILATGGGAVGEAGGGTKLVRAIKQAGTLAKQGGTYGAISGALSSNRRQDVAGNALHGGEVGAVAGPIIGALGAGVARWAAGIARRIAPASEVAAGIGRAVGTGPVTPAERAQGMLRGALEKGGVDPASAWLPIPPKSPTTMMDLGSQPVAKLVRQARNVPASNAGQTVDAFLGERASGTGQRVEQALTDATGHTATDVQEPIEQTLARRAQEAKPLYERAYAHGEIKNPETVAQINDLLKDPVFAKAWKRGQRIMQLEGKGTAGGAPAGISPERWAELQAQGLDQFIPGANTPSAGPSVQQVDLWKRGLDAVIESGAGSKSALSRTEARLYRQRLNDVLTQVDAEVPAYAEARSNYRGHSEVAEAADAGAQHFSPSTSAAYLKRTLPEMSDAEQEAYRANALNAVIAKVRNLAANPDLPEAARGTNIVQRLFGTDDAGQKLRMLFPDGKSYDDFLAQMEQEAIYPKTNRFLTQQSSTAAQLAEGGMSPSAWHDIALSPVSRYSKLRLATRGVRALTGGPGMNPAVADAVAQQATQTGPALRGTLYKMIADRTAQDVARRRALALATNPTAALLGAGSATQP